MPRFCVPPTALWEPHVFHPTTWQYLLVGLAALVAVSSLARLMLARHRELEAKVRHQLEQELAKQPAAAQARGKPREAA